jgi:flagellar biogenesis protein FliO
MIARGSLRPAAIGALGIALVAGLFDPIAGTSRRGALADEDPLPPRIATAASVLEPGVAPARPFPPRPRGAIARRSAERSTGTGGWWFGTAGIALALAVCGGISLATRGGWRWRTLNTAGSLRVVGRTSLSPRHTVHLLSVGQRVLIVGTGPQGPPSLLGELTDPDDIDRLVPGRAEDPNENGKASAVGPASSVQPQSVVVNWRRPRGDDR